MTQTQGIRNAKTFARVLSLACMSACVAASATAQGLSPAAAPAILPAAGATLAAPAAPPAEAAAPPVPVVLRPYSAALDFVGKFGGLDLWAVRGGPVFVATPDGKRAVMGAAVDIDETGGLRDATPGYTGAPAIPIARMLSTALGERIAAARGAQQAAPASSAAVVSAVPAPSVAAVPPAAVPQSAPQSAPQANGKQQVIVTTPGSARATIAGALGVAENDPRVDALMAGAGLDPQSRSDAQAGTGRKAEPPAPAKATTDTVRKGDQEQDILERALYDFAHLGSWIHVGDKKPTTPVVYAFIDPMCPHCAASISRLKSRIDAGQIALRVLLTPYLNADSFGVTAAILRAADPAAALLDHEVARAAGRPGLAPLDPKGQAGDGGTNLTVDGYRLIERNINLFSRENLTGTPFWIWREGGQVKAQYGEKSPEAFGAATPDPSVGLEMAWSAASVPEARKP